MAIEQGLVMFIQAGLPSSPVVPGGYAVQLPKDLISINTPQAWTYRGITSTPTYFLDGESSLTKWQIQLDCHGFKAKDSITLARNIDSVMRGNPAPFTMGDPDATKVQTILRIPEQIDGFNDTNLTFVRSLEYHIFYYQQ